MNGVVKLLLFQSTNTQRITLTKNENGSWLISKEWRHNANEPWVQGKGITIPQRYVQSLGELLLSDGLGDVISRRGIEYIEDDEGVEKGDFNRGYKKNYNKGANNWRKTYANYRKQNPVGRHLPEIC